MVSTLELAWTDRILTGSQTPRRFLDFVIDGEPLYPLMGDLISPLGWLGKEENQRAVDRLLRKEPADAPDRRTCIYVCPECADLGCGAVTAIIERDADSIVWHDFGIHNEIDETVYREGFQAIGPFSFNATAYFDVIRSALMTN